jgi:two-component system copper resistance phosphate regulon response regulator CusR
MAREDRGIAGCGNPATFAAPRGRSHAHVRPVRARAASLAPVKLLYVEDDPAAQQYIYKGLGEHGFLVEVVSDGASGLERGTRGAYDLIILDVMLPDMEGYDVLRRLRQAGVQTPVLFLSARSAVGDRVRGLELGADDYLPKPFAFAELLARIRAVARRRLGEPEEGRLAAGDLTVDLHRRTVERGGRRVDLSPKQFSLLEYLLRHQGHVVSRTMITENVWGWGFESFSNLIDVHINRLRKKIDHGFQTRLIHTVKGAGYILEMRDDEGEAAAGGEDAVA